MSDLYPVHIRLPSFCYSWRIIYGKIGEFTSEGQGEITNLFLKGEGGGAERELGVKFLAIKYF